MKKIKELLQNIMSRYETIFVIAILLAQLILLSLVWLLYYETRPQSAVTITVFVVSFDFGAMVMAFVLSRS